MTGVWRRAAVVAAACYVLFLAAEPFEHHDLACHFRTPLHCAACASSPLGPTPQTASALGHSHFVDVGRALAFLVVGESAILSVRSTGRAPPRDA